MRLSDAMMLGTTLLNHKSGNCGDGIKNGCAVKLAQITLTGEALTRTLPWVSASFPWTNKTSVCPVCNENTEIWHVISVHLNDLHGRSIEYIADYVRSVEPYEVEATEENITAMEQDLIANAV